MVERAFGLAEASESELTKEMRIEHKTGLLPEPLETFEDMSSDEGISQLAFYGAGNINLKKSTEATPAAYEVNKEGNSFGMLYYNQISCKSAFRIPGGSHSIRRVQCKRRVCKIWSKGCLRQ